MADTTRGAPRIRSWPRKRGAKQTKAQRENQQKFMNMQRATKYFAPGMYQYFMEQVEGSPLLPRDVMTMMLSNRLYAFTLPNGRTLWPMPAYQDVSQSLDVITNVEGNGLIRGPDGWIALPGGGAGGGGRFTKLFDITGYPAGPQVDCVLDKNYLEIMVWMWGTNEQSSNIPVFRVSTDFGATYYQANGDYLRTAGDGRLTNASYIRLSSGSQSSGYHCMVTINQSAEGTPPICTIHNAAGAVELFAASPDPINAIRYMAYNGGNISGGRLVIYGR